MSENLKSEEIEKLSKQILLELQSKSVKTELENYEISELENAENSETKIIEKYASKFLESFEQMRKTQNSDMDFPISQNSVSESQSENSKISSDDIDRNDGGVFINNTVNSSFSQQKNNDNFFTLENTAISGKSSHDTVQNVSDYLQKDSRRYDAPLKKF